MYPETALFSPSIHPHGMEDARFVELFINSCTGARIPRAFT